MLNLIPEYPRAERTRFPTCLVDRSSGVLRTACRLEGGGTARRKRALESCLVGAWLCWFGFSASPVVGAVAAQPAKPDRGYAYIHDEVSEVPWSIHIFKVACTNRNVEFYASLGRGTTFGMAVVSQQLRTVPPELGKPLAAVNGDFYDRNFYYRSRPRTLQLRHGEAVTSPEGHPCFWIDPAGQPHIAEVQSQFKVIWPNGKTTPMGLNEARESNEAVLYSAAVGSSTRTTSGMDLVLEGTTNSAWLPLPIGKVLTARVREIRRTGNTPLSSEILVLSVGNRLLSSLPAIQPGTLLQISTETSPNLAGVETAIGGGPTLVHEGQVRKWTSFQLRHPRTALGYNKDYIFLVVVDGRQHGLSVGMTFPELAAYMAKLGCTEAMNLDGGGSATLWAFGEVMNSPCEGRERPAPNALVVVQRNATSR